MAVFYLALRELKSLVGTGRAWVVIALWLLLAGFFWYALVDNYAMQSQDLVFNPYAASMLNLGDYLVAPWFGNMLIVSLLVAPIAAAGMITEEYQRKTFELLLTSPLHTWEIVLGKYLAAMGFSALMLLSTAYVPWSLYQFADPDWGYFVGGYLMLFMVLSVVQALALLASSFTESHLLAVVAAVALSLVIYLLSWLSQDPEGVIAQIAMASHVEDVLRGSLRLSDMVYFAAATFFLLFATQQRLESFRWS